ncbi:hypothetical protein AB0G85_10135 [Streptomyces sioyaensis]|uniref:hypothetical protein n=1 Tax=Streptomyces sioyaensis TaxID=67364 RepID=UPI0033CC41A2
MRRTTAARASAAVLCLGVLLTGCGNAAEQGYAAVGAAGPADGRTPTGAVPPQDGVELTPLDGGGHDDSADGSDGTTSSGRPAARASSRPGSGTDDAARGSASPDGPGASGTRTAPSPGTPPRHSGGSTPAPAPSSPNSPSPSGGSTPPPHGSPSPEPPSPTLPPGPGAPAGLLIGLPRLADTDVRWCEKVTLDFLNTGDRLVTAGTVTFGTHIIGALGIDWATVTSTHKLPLPLARDRKKSGSWRVCVDGWRVPAGMHLETRDVGFSWK